jgi:hypothetical protein
MFRVWVVLRGRWVPTDSVGEAAEDLAGAAAFWRSLGYRRVRVEGV